MVQFRKNNMWNILELEISRSNIKNGYRDQISQILQNKYINSNSIDIIQIEIINATEDNITFLVCFAII